MIWFYVKAILCVPKILQNKRTRKRRSFTLNSKKKICIRDWRIFHTPCLSKNFAALPKLKTRKLCNFRCQTNIRQKKEEREKKTKFVFTKFKIPSQNRQPHQISAQKSNNNNSQLKYSEARAAATANKLASLSRPHKVL